MAWIQVHQTIKDHRKTYDASDALDVEPAHMLGLLVGFWLWALDNAPTGDLQGISNRTIARAAGWPENNADKFVEVLKAAGWLDTTPEGDLQIHDWYEYAGKLIDQRAAEKQRSRIRRTAFTTQATGGRPADDRRTTGKRPADDRQTTGGRPADDRQTTGGRVDYSRVDYTTVDNIKDISPTTSDDGPKKTDLQEERFGVFWSAYPKKVGKQAALKSWKKIKPTAELFERILSSLEMAKQSDQWQREHGRFIPNPTTWLNQGRWDDELTPAGTVATSKPASGRKVDTMGVLERIYREEDAHDQERDNAGTGGNYLSIS